jgi:hypothetical protein
VIDTQDDVQGVSRLMLPSDVRSKTMNDVASAPWNADPAEIMRLTGLRHASTLDLATFAVRPGLRNAGLSVSYALLYGWFAVARGSMPGTLWAHVIPGIFVHP